MFVSISIVLVVGLFAGATEPLGDAVIGTILTVVATAFFCWWGARLKVVRLDEHHLYASNWIREISIPFSHIKAVEALLGGWPATVRLNAKSEFGDAIRFLAPWNPLLFLQDHPIVEELRGFIKQE